MPQISHLVGAGRKGFAQLVQKLSYLALHEFRALRFGYILDAKAVHLLSVSSVYRWTHFVARRLFGAVVFGRLLRSGLQEQSQVVAGENRQGPAASWVSYELVERRLCPELRTLPLAERFPLC